MLIDKLHALTSSRLAVVDVNATVQAAALSLSRPGIGLVVVCNGNGGAEGVLSKSDLVRHLVNSASPVPPVTGRSSKTCAGNSAMPTISVPCSGTAGWSRAVAPMSSSCC